jgi:hypothetical protein
MVYSATYKFTLTGCRMSLSEDSSPSPKAKHVTSLNKKEREVVRVLTSGFLQ